MDLRELIRSLQTTSNLSAMQRATGLHRRTMRRYRPWAATQGLLDTPLPSVEVLHQLVSTTLELPPRRKRCRRSNPTASSSCNGTGTAWRAPRSCSAYTSAATRELWPRSLAFSTDSSRIARRPPYGWNVSAAAQPRWMLAMRAACAIPSPGRSARPGPS